MNKGRLEKLLEYQQNDPNDPFVLYAIANEYNESHPETALAYFESLLIHHPGYLPTYYMAAKLFTEMGQNERAEETYQAGIKLAQNMEDLKTLAELKNAHQNFLFE